MCGQETSRCRSGLELTLCEHAGSWQDGDGQSEGLGGKVQLQVPNRRVPCEGLSSVAARSVSEQMLWSRGSILRNPCCGCVWLPQQISGRSL